MTVAMVCNYDKSVPKTLLDPSGASPPPSQPQVELSALPRQNGHFGALAASTKSTKSTNVQIHGEFIINSTVYNTIQYNSIQFNVWNDCSLYGESTKTLVPELIRTGNETLRRLTMRHPKTSDYDVRRAMKCRHFMIIMSCSVRCLVSSWSMFFCKFVVVFLQLHCLGLCHRTRGRQRCMAQLACVTMWHDVEPSGIFSQSLASSAPCFSTLSCRALPVTANGNPQKFQPKPA